MEKMDRKAEIKKIKAETRTEKIQQKAVQEQKERIHRNMVAYEKRHKRERKIAPKDSFISLQHINKIYDNDTGMIPQQRQKMEIQSSCTKIPLINVSIGTFKITSLLIFIWVTIPNITPFVWDNRKLWKR